MPPTITGLTVFHLPHHAWLISGGVFLLALLTIWYLYKRDIARILKEEQQKRVLLQESLRLQIFELQAQMRPHFIFNAINSIQSYILSQDVDRSLHYLSLLSKLIRKTLENADRELIPLAEELEIVKHFLEIEKMRFDGLLEYDIDISGEIDIETSQIPPMILQPFLDLAIRHGIRQKEKDGLLTVGVDSFHDHTVTITITDNGPGWKQMLTCDPPPQEPGPKSFQLLSQRIALLNLFHNTTAFNVDISDIMSPGNHCSGTCIRLRYLIIEG
jgi:LytS/YehU family sensor histidine kinase